MTAQPDMTGFGRPPAAPTGFRKFAPFVATAATGGVIALLGLYLAQIALPERYRPGYVAGTMAGSETIGHLRTSGDEQISYEVRSQAAQQALGLTTQAMQGSAAIANTADVLCGASKIGENLAGQEASTRSAVTSDAAWWEGFFHRFGDSTCGVGSQVRTAIIGEVTGNGRQSGNLSVRDQDAPLSPIPVKSFIQAYGIKAASRHYSPEEVQLARNYVENFDDQVKWNLERHLTDDPKDWNDIFVERVRAYAYTQQSR